MDTTLVLLMQLGTFGAAVGIVVWRVSVILKNVRHDKDEELQELQSQIDVLQIQIGELQRACKGLGNEGNGFTKTPIEFYQRKR